MVAELSSGFAVVGAGAWLFGRAQPAAVRGTLRSRGLKGFVCPDRAALAYGELAAGEGSKRASRASEDASGIVRKPASPAFEGASGAVPEPANGGQPAERQAAAAAWCSAADRPFLTRIDCGVPVSAISEKVLVAPAGARSGARLLRVVPMSLARSIRTTEFSSEWVVMATRSRTARVALADGESLGVRPDAAVAWTGARPTGFCPRLRLLDVLLPRGPRDLLLHFHGPAIVWIEGSEPLPLRTAAPRRAVF